MSITLDSKEDVFVKEKDVAQQQPVIQKEDQKTQAVVQTVITTLSEEAAKLEAQPSITPMNIITETPAEAPVKAEVETAMIVITVAEKQGVQVPESPVKDNRIALRVHKNGHPKNHGGRLYSLKSDTGHHYLNRHSDGRWFHTDSRGRKQEVPNFDEKYKIVDEHHVRLANEKKV